MDEPDVIPSEQMYADALARARAAEARVEAAEQALRTARKGELALVDEVERLKDASETMREALLMPGEPLCPRCGRKLSQIRHSLTGVCDRHGIQHAASAQHARCLSTTAKG